MIMMFLLGVAVGVQICAMVVARILKNERPYKWACDKCDFKIEGNEMRIVDAMIVSHKEKSHS
jgi:hypothetical protein